MTREEKQKAIDALKISAPVMAVTQEKFNDYIHILNHVMNWLEQESCDDAVSRQAVLDLCDKSTKYDIPYEYYEGKKHIRGWDIGRIININKLIELPSVKPQDCDTCEVGNPCLYCKHDFEPQESEG